MSGDFRIRVMTPHEARLTRIWANREGWNAGRHDVPAFYAADPAGFFLGTLNDRPIAMITGVRYGDHFGFIGHYIVEPDYRGYGYGMAIWRACLMHLENRTIALDSVMEQQENYATFGFVTQHLHIRHGAIGGGTLPEGITPLHDIPFSQIEAYDTRCYGTPRAVFLRSWLQMPEVVSYGMQNSNGSLGGYGVMRRAMDGWRIGPLFADDLATADLLYRALRAYGPGEMVYLDIPDSNPAAIALVARHRMAEGFLCARMVKGTPLPITIERVFGVTSLELG